MIQISIASQIERIKNNIAAAYSVCERKDATMPQLQNSNNLATTIWSISAGGGTPVKQKDVNFFDYDGTLLYSYTAAEAGELSALPALPLHSGLTATGWTHTLSQIQHATQKINVGCYYETSDGKTHIRILLKNSGIFEFALIQSAANAAVIDWGDGSPTETLSISNGTKSGRTRYIASHTYTTYPAEYDISISAVSGQWYGFGVDGQSGYGVTRGNASYGACIKRIYLSEDANLNGGSFYNTGGMETVTCSEIQSQSFGLQYSFCNCYSLRHIIVYEAESSAFNNCRSLQYISFRPDFCSTHTIGEYAFANCYSLKEIIIPQGVNTISQYAFYFSKSAERIVIPDSVVTIAYSAFSGASREITRLIEVDLTAFSLPASIPTLESNLGVTFPFLNYTEEYIPFYVANAQMKEAFENDTKWSSEGTDFFAVR